MAEQDKQHCSSSGAGAVQDLARTAEARPCVEQKLVHPGLSSSEQSAEQSCA